eukprot:6874681-Prymnesium_polylepis.3
MMIDVGRHVSEWSWPSLTSHSAAPTLDCAALTDVCWAALTDVCGRLGRTTSGVGECEATAHIWNRAV